MNNCHRIQDKCYIQQKHQICFLRKHKEEVSLILVTPSVLNSILECSVVSREFYKLFKKNSRQMSTKNLEIFISLDSFRLILCAFITIHHVEIIIFCRPISQNVRAKLNKISKLSILFVPCTRI